MHIPSLKNSSRKVSILFILFVLGAFSLSFSQEAAPPKEDDSKFSTVQKQAREYRAQGLLMQKMGNNEEALKLYQKASELDSAYAVVQNDLGVLYEEKGLLDKAETCYKKALAIDPNYLSPYSNLALLCEKRRELDKAAFYWKKRIALGSPQDPWTEKAKQRLSDIQMVLSKNPAEDAREQDTLNLVKDVTVEKSILQQDNKELAKANLEKAKLLYKKGDELTALKIAIDATQLDPSNVEINNFVEKLQTRVLSK